jgi:hypothetical protein
MGFIDNPPITGKKNGEIRYYAFVTPYGRKNVLVMKVRCLSKSFDKEEERFIYNCKVEEIITQMNEILSVGNTITVNSEWHLQETEKDAKRLIIYTLFERGLYGFFSGTPPF